MNSFNNGIFGSLFNPIDYPVSLANQEQPRQLNMHYAKEQNLLRELESTREQLAVCESILQRTHNELQEWCDPDRITVDHEMWLDSQAEMHNLRLYKKCSIFVWSGWAVVFAVYSIYIWSVLH